jgi:hypothetical protein
MHLLGDCVDLCALSGVASAMDVAGGYVLLCCCCRYSILIFILIFLMKSGAVSAASVRLNLSWYREAICWYHTLWVRTSSVYVMV